MARTERKLASSGSRFVMIGLPLVVIGIVLALLLDHNSVGIGVAIAVLGAIPTVLGLVADGVRGRLAARAPQQRLGLALHARGRLRRARARLG